MKPKPKYRGSWQNWHLQPQHSLQALLCMTVVTKGIACTCAAFQWSGALGSMTGMEEELSDVEIP